MMVQVCTSCRRNITEQELLYGSAVKYDQHTIFCGDCVKSGLSKRGFLTEPQQVVETVPAQIRPKEFIIPIPEENPRPPAAASGAQYTAIRGSGVVPAVGRGRSGVTPAISPTQVPLVPLNPGQPQVQPQPQRRTTSGIIPRVVSNSGQHVAVGNQSGVSQQSVGRTTGKHRAVGRTTGQHRAVGRTTGQHRAVGTRTGQHRAVSGSGTVRAVGLPAPRPPTPAAANEHKEILLVLGGTAAVLVLIVAMFALTGGSKPKDVAKNKDDKNKSSKVSSEYKPPLPPPPVIPKPLPYTPANAANTRPRTSRQPDPVREVSTTKMAPLISEREAANTETQDIRQSVSSEMLKAAREFRLGRPSDVDGFRRKLSDILKSYADTPAGEEAKRIIATLEPDEPTLPPDAVKTATSPAWLTEWQIENLEKHAKVQMFEMFDGKQHVLETHPPAVGESVRLKRKLPITAGKSFLKLGVRGLDAGDFEMVVEVDGKRVLDETIAGGTWQNFYINLTPLAGKEAAITVLHMPTGWDDENAYWLAPRLVDVPATDGKTVTLDAPEAKKPNETDLADDPAWRNALNLLRYVDPGEDAVAGVWSLQDDGSMICDKTSHSRLELPYLPPAEYDFRIVFSRTDGIDPVSQVFVSKGRQMTWSLGGTQKPSGFYMYNAAGTPEAQAKIDAQLTNGRKHTCVIQVRSGRLAAYLNGKLLSQMSPPGTGNVSYFDLKPSESLMLCLDNANNTTIFHSVDVLEVEGKGRLIRETRSNADTARGDLKIEYERLLSEAYTLLLTKGVAEAKARVQKAKGDALLAPLSGKLELDLKTIGFMDDIKTGVVEGLKKLAADKSIFTLRVTNGKDVALSSTRIIKSVEGQSINISDKVDGGEAHSKVEIDQLVPQTKYALAAMGLPNTAENRLKLAFAGMFFKRASNSGITDEDIKGYMKHARDGAPPEIVEHVQKCMDFEARERSADTLALKIEAHIQGKQWGQAKDAVDVFKTDLLNTYALHRFQARLKRWSGVIEEGIKAAAKAAVPPPPPPPPPPPKK